MKIRVLLLPTLLAFVFCVDSVACGDSLHRVGKGVSYRVYTAPLPGMVLVFGQSDSAKQLVAALARSGHGVQLVVNEADLKTELQKGKYDVVIAQYSEHELLETDDIKAMNSAPVFLPVVESDEEELLARQSYERVMLADRHEFKHYLKAIHKTLKSKI